MAVNLSPIGGVAGQFFDNNGNPLTGGKIFTYSAGTTTPQTAYTSANGVTPHSNPIILDAAGRVPGGEIWLTDGLQYKFVIKTSTDVQIGSYDNIIGINSNFVNYTNSQEIQTATAGQTVFTLTTMQYQPNTNSLSVFVDGVNQYGPGSQYAFIETSATVVTFTSGLHVGAEVKFTTSSINASSYGDAEQIGYLPPFTGSVPTNVEVKLAQTVSVKDFGAVGDGLTDDTVAIQSAIDAVASGGRVLGDAQSTFAVAGRIDLISKELRDIRLTYTSNSAFLVLGGSARLTNTNISVGSTIRSFTGPLAGVINLHLATGVVVDNVEITDGITDRIGVFCSTLASNTTVRNCRMNYIGWPILYNDAVPAQRIVDAVDYAGQSIGQGLYIYDCELGAADKTSVGDAIEINCPSERFTNVKVNNCVALKVNTNQPDNGLGFGFADIDGIQVSNCLIRNCANASGAIHFEAHTNASISNNTVELCNVGIGLGIDGQDTLISGNTISKCGIGVQCVGSAASMNGVTIVGNQFLDSDDNHIVFVNVDSGLITSNLFKNIVVAGGTRSYISMQQTGGLTTTRHIISGNAFVKTTGSTHALLGLSGTVSEVISDGNSFTGVGATAISGYLVAVRSVGLSKDHYDTVNPTSGIFGTTTADPTGYITGSSGDFVTDVNGGVIYRFDGTNWVAEVS